MRPAIITDTAASNRLVVLRAGLRLSGGDGRAVSGRGEAGVEGSRALRVRGELARPAGRERAGTGMLDDTRASDGGVHEISEREAAVRAMSGRSEREVEEGAVRAAASGKSKKEAVAGAVHGARRVGPLPARHGQLRPGPRRAARHVPAVRLGDPVPGRRRCSALCARPARLGGGGERRRGGSRLPARHDLQV